MQTIRYCFLHSALLDQLQRLEPEDINDNTIIVSQEYGRRNGILCKYIFALVQTKGKRSRYVYMTDSLKRIVANQIEYADSISNNFPHNHGLLFLYPNGSIYKKSTVEKDFRKHLQDYTQKTGIDLSFIKLHTLRHSFATLLFGHEHPDDQAVSEQLGHSSVSVTNRIYRHQSEAAERDYKEKKSRVDAMLDELIDSIEADSSPKHDKEDN